MTLSSYDGTPFVSIPTWYRKSYHGNRTTTSALHSPTAENHYADVLGRRFVAGTPGRSSQQEFRQPGRRDSGL
jgi:hypothetical protein